MVENGTAAASTGLTVAYNAATGSYTVTVEGSSASFGAAERVASQSTAQITAYQKVDGSKVAALALSNPGTSGVLTYRYVGGGSLERSDIGASTTAFRYDAFTYGIVTPDPNLPRSGTGLYAIDVVGARGIDQALPMGGAGILQADFLSGAVETRGLISTVDPTTGQELNLGSFFGTAAMTSGQNVFSGRFQFFDGLFFDGGWKGRFYGPGAEEVGATWQITASDGEFASGWLIGRQDQSVPARNASLPLRYAEAFEHRFGAINGRVSAGGIADAGADLFRSDATIAYDPASGAYRYVDAAAGLDQSFAPASRVSAESTAATSVYRITATDGTRYTLSLSNPGAGNPDIQLTYASLGRWQREQTAGAVGLDRWFVWGVRTNGFQIPTGTGTYSGIIRGSAVTMNGGAAYTLAGTSSFAVDFGARSFTGSLNPVGTSLVDGSTRNFGSFSFGGGAMDLDGALSANVVNGSSAYLGFFEGALYGSGAAELGGSFGFQTEPSGSGGTVGASAAYLAGATVAKRQ